ncbi:MAG: hypothetical protein HYX27_01535 [Acidobacteria bacterium]|nr:hypothetical protein [Acidobacteriota bacterium]
MRRSNTLFLRIVCGFFAVISLLCVYGAATNLWTYLRMRSVPVEVVRSALLIDCPVNKDGAPLEPEFTLSLDLVTRDGSERPIHWEDSPANAAYAEEAIDEVARWAPGSRHVIHQIRGEGRAIRLPGSGESPERTAAIGFAIAAVFMGFIALVVLGVDAETESWFRRSALSRMLGVWVVFFLVGIGALTASILFAATQMRKIVSWPAVTATVEDSPAIYGTPKLPANVTITPAALKWSESNRHSVITFPWNGATIHGGIGRAEGRYDALHATCWSSGTTCHFRISPTDRWSVAVSAGWNSDFFVPTGMFLLFGVAFTGAGLVIRRRSF